MKKHEPSALDQLDQNTDEETFLNRWSRRKLGNDAVEERVETRNLQESSNSVEPQVERQLSEASVDDAAREASRLELTDEDMPPLESLDENSDYSAFFSPRVSETLRRQALQKLFHLPQFNISDGLNDYDDDYTQHEKLGSVVTHEVKRALQRNAEKHRADKADKQQQQDVVHQQADGAESTESLAGHTDALATEKVAGNIEKNTVTHGEVIDEASIDRNTTEI
ncbi:DUF3306 domain-containing protein [Kaarinaea lacus]